MKKKSPHAGSSFDSFLVEEGILADVEVRAAKRVIAWQLDELRKHLNLTKAALAKQMQTSRSELDRLLDPDNTSLTLGSLTKAAAALGKRLKIAFVDPLPVRRTPRQSRRNHRVMARAAV
jgi:transcriptional regulator with XRE-family HTH domain